MLDAVRPDVVHITTPPGSHFTLAKDALARDAHVFIEKPVTVKYDDFVELRRIAKERNRWLIEDHNYQFNRPVQKILKLIESGEFGDVVHMDLMYCLNLVGKGSSWMDANVPRPDLKLPGGAIVHFVSHLAYLCYLFVGPHRGVRTIWSKRLKESPLPSDEMRALVDGERATAHIGFSAHSQPDGVWLRVHGTKMRAHANLFEGRLTFEPLRKCAKPLLPIANAYPEAKEVKRSAWRSLGTKLRGAPGAYEGLWELVSRVYRALGEQGGASPIPIEQIDHTNRLVADMLKEELRV
jgi:predicted dehydrogenase